MRKALGVSCYNSANELVRAIAPWYDHVDEIIMIDGKYQTPQSPEMKKHPLPDFSTDDTKHVAFTNFGDKLTYEKFTADQMTKRQRCLDIAGEKDCDYLIVFDTDDFLHPEYQNWDLFEKHLDLLLKHWDDRLFYMWCWIPGEDVWSKQHNEVLSNHWNKYVRVHKDPGNMRYALTHYTFCDKSVTDDEIREWRWNNKKQDPILDCPLLLHENMIVDGVRVTTDRKFRSKEMLQHGDNWAFQNIHWEIYHHGMLPAAKRIGRRVALQDYEYFFKPWNGDVVRWTYNKDGTVMTKKQVERIKTQEEKIYQPL